jgi:hypothetical protein
LSSLSPSPPPPPPPAGQPKEREEKYIVRGKEGGSPPRTQGGRTMGDGGARRTVSGRAACLLACSLACPHERTRCGLSAAGRSVRTVAYRVRPATEVRPAGPSRARRCRRRRRRRTWPEPDKCPHGTSTWSAGPSQSRWGGVSARAHAPSPLTHVYVDNGDANMRVAWVGGCQPTRWRAGSTPWTTTRRGPTMRPWARRCCCLSRGGTPPPPTADTVSSPYPHQPRAPAVVVP